MDNGAIAPTMYHEQTELIVLTSFNNVQTAESLTQYPQRTPETLTIATKHTLDP